MIFLACGAGMQSTALALMACENVKAGYSVHPLVPIYNAILFCDLGCENPWVYNQVAFIQKVCDEYHIPFYILNAKNLYDVYMSEFGYKKSVVAVPFWTTGDDGNKSKMRRHCTIDFKILQMQNFIRTNLLGYAPGQHKRAFDIGAHEMHIGFSVEEKRRFFKSQHPFYINKFPLAEMGMSRADCFRYNLETWGLETKASSCIICPFHRNYFFGHLKANYPDEYAKILTFDSMLQERQPLSPIRSKIFISCSRKRIEDLKPYDCDDGKYFPYRNQMIWNGF